MPTETPAPTTAPADLAPEEWNRELRALRTLAPPTRFPARILVATAHPDDETIGAGRLVAAASHAGSHVAALTATAGEACAPGGDPDPHLLARTRLEEWRGALGELGAEPLETGRLPDGGLADRAAALRRLLEEAAGRWRAEAIWTTWRGDPHPDHAAIGAASRDVGRALGLEVVEFPVWTMTWLRPADVRDVGAELVHVPLDPANDAARDAALRRYRSQLEPLRDGWPPVVPARALARHGRQYLVVGADRARDTSAQVRR